MFPIRTLFLTALSAFVAAAATSFDDEALVKRSTSVPTVWLAGDSTMTIQPSTGNIQGWGVYLIYSLTGATINNKAHSGASIRTFNTTGRFDAIVAGVQPGDYVIIEFGHNDSGNPATDVNDRVDCPGAGNTTCISAKGEVVQTYSTYAHYAGLAMIAKGARVIISSPTPDDPCYNSTKCSAYKPSQYVGFGKAVAAGLGPNASFVDHESYTDAMFLALGAAVVNAWYPNDHTHTSPKGADIAAGAFVKGLLCTNNPLSALVKNTTESVAGACS